MNSKKGVVIVTTSFYQSEEKLRFNLACKTVIVAKKNGYKIVVVDGSSNPEISKKLKELGAIVFNQVFPGMGPSRRQVFFWGAEIAKMWGANALFWIEPEKFGMIDFIPQIYQAILKGAEIAIPFRTPKSWNSYPEFQVNFEKRQNRTVSQVNKREDMDCAFGPVMYALKAVHYVIDSNPKLWGVEDEYIVQFMPTYANKRGASIASVPVDFIYPPEQREAEENAREKMEAKRRRQLTTVAAAHKKVASIR